MCVAIGKLLQMFVFNYQYFDGFGSAIVQYLQPCV